MNIVAYCRYTVERLPLFAAVDKGVVKMAGKCDTRLSSGGSWVLVLYKYVAELTNVIYPPVS